MGKIIIKGLTNMDYPQYQTNMKILFLISSFMCHSTCIPELILRVFRFYRSALLCFRPLYSRRSSSSAPP